MTETGREISEVLKRFSQGMREGKFAELSIFTEDVELQCSHTGSGKGREQVNVRLAYPGPKAEYVKQNIENVITHWTQEKGCQSFHLHHLYWLHADNGSFHFLQYGGTFVLHYRREQERWRIEKVLFDLCWADGNSGWLQEWKLIDFRMPKQQKQIICGKRDGVWHVIPKTAEKQTEEEQIKEVLFLYGWVIDTEDYDLLDKIALPEIEISDGYHGRSFFGTEAWKAFLKELNQKEPCLHHTYRIREIEAGEERARAFMSRLEPNRIGSKTIGEETKFFDWFTLDYTVELQKEEGNWKMSRVQFRKNIRGEMCYES